MFHGLPRGGTVVQKYRSCLSLLSTWNRTDHLQHEQLGSIDFATNLPVCPFVPPCSYMNRCHHGIAVCPISWIRASVLKLCALALSVETPPVGMPIKATEWNKTS